MMFEVCECLRELLAEINDNVLDKFNKILEAQEAKDKLESGPMISNN